MGEPLPEDEDRRLAIMFRPAAQPVADDGFSEAVMRRVSRLAWRRRAVLASAGIVGVAAAAGPAWQIAVTLGRDVALVSGRWTELAWLIENPLALAVAGLLLVAGPSLLDWIEE